MQIFFQDLYENLYNFSRKPTTYINIHINVYKYTKLQHIEKKELKHSQKSIKQNFKNTPLINYSKSGKIVQLFDCFSLMFICKKIGPFVL